MNYNVNIKQEDMNYKISKDEKQRRRLINTERISKLAEEHLQNKQKEKALKIFAEEKAI